MPDAGGSAEAGASSSIVATVRRMASGFVNNNLGDWAAALTYYGLLAVFPALIAVVALVGLVADPTTTTQRVTEIVTNLGPEASTETFQEPIDSITSNRAGAGVGFVLGLAFALWAASGYVRAFARAANTVYEVPEGRPVWRLLPVQLLLTFVLVVLAAVVALALVMTGPVVNAVAEPFGVTEQAVRVFDAAKWPALAVVVLALIALLYYATPNVRLRGLRAVVPGAVLALALWGIASVGFGIFVANFGSYDKTYGTLAGIIIGLVWLYLTNLSMLLGAQLNAERERGRKHAAGAPGTGGTLGLRLRLDPRGARSTTSD
jgi:membrane protein